MIPEIAVAVRRLHDTGRSGFYILFSFIPFIGGIILIIFLVDDSQPFPNIYGPSPKYDNNENPILPQGNYLPPQGNIVVQGNVVYPQNNISPGQGNIVIPPGNETFNPQINTPTYNV